MPNRISGVNTICPFYLIESGKSISCEGLIEGTRLMTRFVSEADKIRYQESVCEMYNYEHACPIAALLMKKYEENE